MVTKEEMLACINALSLNANPYEGIWKGKVESYSENVQGCMSNKEKKCFIKLRDFADGQTYKLVKKASNLNTDLLIRLERKCQVYYLWSKTKLIGSESFVFEGSWNHINYYWVIFPQEDFERNFPYSLNERSVKTFLLNEKLTSLNEENTSLVKQLRRSEEQNLQLQQQLGQFQARKEQQIQIKQEEVEQTVNIAKAKIEELQNLLINLRIQDTNK